MRKMMAGFTAAMMAMAMMLSACSSSAPATTAAPAEATAAAAETTAAAAAETTAAAAANTNYPGNKNVVLYCGYSAGGSSDTLCRLMAAKVSEKLGTTVTVENVTGASGWVLWNQMLENTPADGYSFCLVNSPNVTAGKYDTANPMKYDQNDFELVCNQVTDSSCLAIRADDDRYSDFQTFVDYWKQEGVLITSASGAGITSDDSTSAMLMSKDLGTEVDIVPSKGSGDNVTFLLNGTTDFLMGNVSEMVAAHNDGQYKILCVFAEERDPNLPEVPTYEELTGNKVIGCSSRGYAILKDTPEDIKPILEQAIKDAVNDPDMIQQLMDIYTTTDFKEGQEYIDYLNEMQQTARDTWGV